MTAAELAAIRARTDKATPYERIVQVSPAWDKRHPDPNKNYGICCVELRFVLRNEVAAMQFVCSTGMYLPHVAEELHSKSNWHNPFAPMGIDIGYHARTPQYEGQSSMGRQCEYLGCECYYDGTSLGAAEFMPTFLAKGQDAVWVMLEDRHRERFGEPPARTDIVTLLDAYEALRKAAGLVVDSFENGDGPHQMIDKIEALGKLLED